VASPQRLGDIVLLRSGKETKSLAFDVSLVVKKITTSFGSSHERKTRGCG
jgi:hypothetical protein